MQKIKDVNCGIVINTNGINYYFCLFERAF